MTKRPSDLAVRIFCVFAFGATVSLAVVCFWALTRIELPMSLIDLLAAAWLIIATGSLTILALCFAIAVISPNTGTNP